MIDRIGCIELIGDEVSRTASAQPDHSRETNRGMRMVERDLEHAREVYR